MGWDGCGGVPETDLDGIGWYGRSGLGMRVWGGGGEPGTGVEVLGWF